MGGLPGTNFIKLDLSEIHSKLSSLADSKEIVKIWLKGADPCLYRVADALFGKQSGLASLVLFGESDEQDGSFDGKRVFVGFEIGDINYFTEARVVRDSAGERLTLNLEPNIYRSEKRSNERLLTFPHHQVYAYFKIPKAAAPVNVIPLKKVDESYASFKRQQKERMLKELEKKIGDVEDLVGFRAMDVSNNGISFLVTEEEISHFSSKDKRYDFTLLFDGNAFAIKASKIIYKVEFVTKKDNREQSFKVGMNFNPDTTLSQLVNDILKKSELTGFQRDFENFIDD
jgi:hypothetical protein